MRNMLFLQSNERKTYTPADAILGALEESGDARRYDINGTGQIQHFQFLVAEG
ncbi:MAG: hypothetical protein Q4G24_16160 [Paracoccus sp. (in: a-proteobacteria)]|uniref:hypothetical protein n=1 Tax=Paracoccus sp. TaxID=267 RepID=UPI0026DF1B4C|nr:hypothetical protein [Paracoccus sp. (in: a-proteobacteria)]MDO5622981.1 hypothetical protein [Paracoccus sp. (in: a-proteobacteria)]